MQSQIPQGNSFTFGEITELAYVFLATILLILVLFFGLQKQSDEELYDEFNSVNIVAYNIYQEITEFAQTENLGARKTIILDDQIKIEDGQIKNVQYESEVSFFIQGTSCTGENEIVKLVEGIAICCGKCDGDVRLTFPKNIMCSPNKEQWISCDSYPEGHLGRIAVLCDDTSATLTLSRTSEIIIETHASSQWGEYLIYPIRVSIPASTYTADVCENSYYIRSIARGQGGGGSGSSGSNNGDSGEGDDDDGDTHNTPPVALMNATPRFGTAPLIVTFNPSGSHDSDGEITQYRYDFNGDGNIDVVSANSIPVQHIYSISGDYLANLTVVDNNDSISSYTTLVEVYAFTDYEDNCLNPTKEQYYFERLEIELINHTNGMKDFKLSKDGILIRNASQNAKLFRDVSDGQLNIDYEIVIAECNGGVDVVYTIHNPSASPQIIPNLSIPNIYLPNDNESEYLWLLEGSSMRSVEQEAALLRLPYVSDRPYSPVIVNKNKDFAVGTAYLYPFLEYEHTIEPALSRVRTSQGVLHPNWEHLYRYATSNPKTTSLPATINSGETRTYTITVRVTQPRYWIFTLQPYKEYFNQLYDGERSVQPRSSAIRAFSAAISNFHDPVQNPKAFRPLYGARADIDGWTQIVSGWINEIKTEGWNRTMLWAVGGMYHPDPQVGCYYMHRTIGINNCNYPPHIMTHWNEPMLNTSNEFLRFNQEGIELGIWYGHGSSMIPVPDQWDPITIVRFDPTNQTHRDFVFEQVGLSRARGANEIGLDAFSMNELELQYYWIDELKQREPNLKFMRESAGNDIIHTKMSLFHNNVDGRRVNSPHYLARYLNPNSELTVYMRDADFIQATTDNPSLTEFDIIQNLVRWGYTPIAMRGGIHVHDLDYALAQCMDGIDNDDDGLTDWPFDSDCDSYEDNNEME